MVSEAVGHPLDHFDLVVDAGGMYGVRVEVKNPKHLLPAGLKCQVRFPGK